MKRVVLVVLVILALMCGCAKNSITVGKFSYADVVETYSEETIGVRRDGFVNTEKSDVINAERAIELAKKECTIDYNSINVSYDNQENIYCVEFATIDTLGGCQSVYISAEGITVLIISGE